MSQFLRDVTEETSVHLHLAIDGDDCIGDATKYHRSVDIWHQDFLRTYSSSIGRAISVVGSREIGIGGSCRKWCRVVVFVDRWRTFRAERASS